MPDRVEIDHDERVARTVRQIGVSGNSLVIRIPPQLLEFANLEQGDQVELVADWDEETISVRAFEHDVDDSSDA